MEHTENIITSSMETDDTTENQIDTLKESIIQNPESLDHDREDKEFLEDEMHLKFAWEDDADSRMLATEFRLEKQKQWYDIVISNRKHIAVDSSKTQATKVITMMLNNKAITISYHVENNDVILSKKED